jgi:hypothetical protein
LIAGGLGKRSGFAEAIEEPFVLPEGQQRVPQIEAKINALLDPRATVWQMRQGI